MLLQQERGSVSDSSAVAAAIDKVVVAGATPKRAATVARVYAERRPTPFDRYLPANARVDASKTVRFRAPRPDSSSLIEKKHLPARTAGVFHWSQRVTYIQILVDNGGNRSRSWSK